MNVGGRREGKSLLSCIVVAYKLSKNRKLSIDCTPNYAKILSSMFPHINLIKDGNIFTASFPRCEK